MKRIQAFQQTVIALAFSFFILHPTESSAQTFTDSNLPIIIITTDGNTPIPDAPRIMANMKIINKGDGVRNALTDQNDPTALNYNGRINIEIRGSSSQFLEKKQYGLSTLMPDDKTNNNVSLLGMPKENDWVLNSLPFEPSLMRDYISYTLSRAIGEYAPRAVYCEVLINGNYRGLYMLQEKVKIDDNRVNVTKIDPGDIALPNLSGGYLIKADKITQDDPSAWTMSSYIGNNDVNFVFEFPRQGIITYQQAQYIQAQFKTLATKAAEGNTSPVDGYPSIIDIPSFVNFILLNELSANVDAYQFSTFFHKDKRGKLRAGPLWDLNLTYGNDLFMWGFDRSKTNTWQFDNGDNIGARFWKDLFSNSKFRCYLSRRWNSLIQNGQPLNLTNINNLIDETASHLSESVARENGRWGAVGDHNTRVNVIKDFLAARIAWMTNSLGPHSPCDNVTLPPLVISKIMYNPSTSPAFTSSSDQEFVEVINNGSEAIDLTGIYFSGTGFCYQFPSVYSMPAKGVIHLANHLETFEKRYGISPFGEFARNLDNEGQHLILADAFGNVIDEVTYSNQAPWPDASANGMYIKLKDSNLDNNIGSNWMSSNDVLSTNTIAGIEPINLNVFPNPTFEELLIESEDEIILVRLYNPKGELLCDKRGHDNLIKLDLRNYQPGLYCLAIQTKTKSIKRRIIKSTE